jgi:hypothetical protein
MCMRRLPIIHLMYLRVQVRRATAVLEPLCGRLCVGSETETAAEIARLRQLCAWLLSHLLAYQTEARLSLWCPCQAATLYVIRCVAVLRLTGEAGDASRMHSEMQSEMNMQPEMQPGVRRLLYTLNLSLTLTLTLALALALALALTLTLTLP